MSEVRFELAPSPLFAAAIAGAHLVAGVAAYIVLPGLPGVLLAIAFVSLGAAAAWSRALLRSRHSVRAIRVGSADPMFELAGGESLSAPVGQRRYVTRHVVALPLGRPLGRTLLVTRDMLGAQEFRRLRLWALWGRLPGVARKQLAA